MKRCYRFVHKHKNSSHYRRSISVASCGQELTDAGRIVKTLTLDIYRAKLEIYWKREKMELSFSLCLLGILSLWNLVEVQGHGMMLEPASRNSAWRYGWGTPVQHTDNELNCGGAAAQKANGGM